MKFKNILFAASMLIASFTCSAASYTVTTTNNPAGLWSLVSTNRGGTAIITSISIQNTNANTYANVRFYDSPNGTNVYATGTYTNVAQSLVQITNIYTNVFNVPYTNIYSGMTNTLSAVAAGTANYPLILPVIVGTNNTTYTWTGRMPFYRGLASSNDTRVVIQVTYEQ